MSQTKEDLAAVQIAIRLRTALNTTSLQIFNQKDLARIIVLITPNIAPSVCAAYTKLCSRDLVSDIKRNCKKNFETVCISLVQSKSERQARKVYSCLRETKYSNLRESTSHAISEVFLFNSADQNRDVVMSYRGLFNIELVDDLLKYSPFIGDLLVLTFTHRVPHDPSTVLADAEALKDIKENFFAEKITIQLACRQFASRLILADREHVDAIKMQYAQLYSQSLSQDIEALFGGNKLDDHDDSSASLEIRAVLEYACMGQVAYHGQDLIKAMDRIGTNETTVLRNVIEMRDVDGLLSLVNAYILAKTQRSLTSWLQDKVKYIFYFGCISSMRVTRIYIYLDLWRIGPVAWPDL